jgi:hypothetical protein
VLQPLHHKRRVQRLAGLLRERQQRLRAQHTAVHGDVHHLWLDRGVEAVERMEIARAVDLAGVRFREGAYVLARHGRPAPFAQRGQRDPAIRTPALVGRVIDIAAFAPEHAVKDRVVSHRMP